MDAPHRKRRARRSSAIPFDPVPAPLRVKRRLMSNARALRSIHFPSSMAERDIARRRLAYEECLYLQLALRLRNDGGLVDVVPMPTPRASTGRAQEALPFSLSEEQEAAFQDILRDMCDGGRVMNRLLLGDVGTGKTAVAACALAVAADSGTQACVMAPTGVLARQYADKTGPLLSRPACPGASDGCHAGLRARADPCPAGIGRARRPLWYPCGAFG